jgi:hypothetical protein
MTCHFLVGLLLPDLQMMDYCDHGRMYNVHFLKIISSELKRKSKILSRKQVPDRKLKNLAYRAPCSSPLFILVEAEVLEF